LSIPTRLSERLAVPLDINDEQLKSGQADFLPLLLNRAMLNLEINLAQEASSNDQALKFKH
jgi:hypothetical protein